MKNSLSKSSPDDGFNIFCIEPEITFPVVWYTHSTLQWYAKTIDSSLDQVQFSAAHKKLIKPFAFEHEKSNAVGHNNQTKK